MAKFRIKLSLLAILFSVSAIIFLLSYYFYEQKPIYSWKIDNFTFVFRGNLREAEKIPVYPSEENLNSILTSKKLKNITIAFKDAGEENYYYSLEAYEIAYKLSLFYKIKGMQVSFAPLEIDSYENLKGSEENIIIALVHPKFSTENGIRIEDYVIYVKARDLKNFDLAVIKLLMCAMQIKI